MLKIVPVVSRAQLKKFLVFSIDLYKGNPYYVPSLVADDIKLFQAKHNPAFGFCESQCFLCYRDNRIVGRIAAIINHKANNAWGKLNGRFGFVDFIEDFEVAKLLIQTAENWVRERGMTSLEGPLGFTDFDPEGMLIEGFDQLGTMSTIYNFPYYPQYMERLGYKKEADWVEFKITIPGAIPDRVEKLSQIVARRSSLRVLRLTKPSQVIKGGWGEKIFELTNIAFSELFGYSALSPEQMKSYVMQYIPMVRMELLTMIVDKDDNLVAYGLGLPSLSRALQKSRGRMWPFGFIHLLSALKSKRAEICDLMLIAIHPDYQGKGVNAMIMSEFIPGLIKFQAKYAESNQELETNGRIHEQWDSFEHVQHKRRRAFIKSLE